MTGNKVKLFIIFGAIALLLIILITWIIWGNTALTLTKYTVSSQKIPKSFDGYRIAQISDLHNDEMGRDNVKLIEMLKEAEADIIVITGDLIDSRTPDVNIALEFAKNALELAPCYFVSGNHESRVPIEYAQLKSGLLDLGVKVLENEEVKLQRGNSSINLIGIDDPSVQPQYYFGDSETSMKGVLRQFSINDEEFNILLSHRPETFDAYVYRKIDLALTGHAHGGQFRLPSIGGLYAPQQGIFPEYDGGLFKENDTTMIVSRGVGNSLFPFRFNNRPEVVVAELRCE